MAGKTLRFYNLTGGLNTIQDLATINSTPNRTESPDMKNVEYYKYGGIRTMKGNRNILSTPLVTDDGIEINCGYEYLTKNKSTMIVVDGWSRVYRYDQDTKELVNVIDYAKANGWTVEDGYDYFQSPTSGNYKPLLDENINAMGQGWVEGKLRNINRHCIVSYNNGIIVTNGYSLLYYNQEDKVIKNYIPRLVQKFTEGTTETIVNIPIQSNVIAAYKGRLFLASDELKPFYNKPTDNSTYTNTASYDNTLYYSGVGYGNNTDDTYWIEGAEESDAGRYNNFFGDNSLFTALMPWSEYLVIHKSEQTYLLDGTSSDSSQWVLSPYSNYSVDSQQGIVVANSAYYGYVRDAGGIYPILQRSIYNSTYQGAELSFKIKDSLHFIDLEKLDTIYATFHPINNWLMFYIPELTGDYSNHCYIFDIKTKTWLYREVPQNVTCAFKFNNKVYIGTKDGLVLEELYGTTFNGEPIDFYWLSPSYMWGGGTDNTTTREFRVKLVNEGSNHFYVESLRDGNTIETKKRLISNQGDNLNGLIWDIGINQGTPSTKKEDTDNDLFDTLTELGDFNPANYDYNTSTATYQIKTIPTKVWRYVTSNGTYYSKDNPLKTSSKIYSDPELKTFVGYYNDNIFYVKDTSGDVTLIEYVTKVAYAWREQTITDICFRNNNGIMAWVPIGGGVAKTNLKTVTTSKQEITQIGLRCYRLSPNLTWDVRINTNDYQTKWNTPNIYIEAWVGQDGQGFVHSNNQGSFWIWTGTEARDDFGTGERNKQLVVRQTSSGVNVSIGSGFSRYQANDNVQTITTTTEQPSGTSPLSITKTYTPTNVTPDTQSITIKVNGVDTPLTRYSSGDFKTGEGSIVYTSLENPTTDDKASSNLSMGEDLNITAVGSNYIQIGNSKYLRYTTGNNSYTIEQPYQASSVFKDVTPSEISSTDRIYDYQNDYIRWKTNRSLTDTVWDLNSWLALGYQTKRFLLPNQYFQTVQYRFSGTALTDSICLAGFEVDGIQLTEVPY